MTPEEIRVAVAEALGWEHGSYGGIERWFNTKQGEGNDATRAWPDYPNDLNACAEMERTLKVREIQSDYARRLVEVLNRDLRNEPRFIGATQFDQMTATALQRCEAFLRVHGLWREEA